MSTFFAKGNTKPNKIQDIVSFSGHGNHFFSVHTITALPFTVKYSPTVVTYHLLLYCFQVLGQFIARAVADECLAKDFPSQYKGKVDCDLVR